MKKFERQLSKINFKKVVVIYLVVAIVAGIVSVSVLGYIFRDKIKFMAGYNKIAEKMEDNIDATKIEPDLINFAKKNADVVDVLILDNNNKILFSAKDSPVAKSGTLNLQRDAQWDNRNKFMTDPANPDVMYRLIKNERLPRSLDAVVKGFSSRERYDDEYFFGANSVKTVYSLSYARGGRANNKTYFIFNITPVKNSIVYIKVVAAAAMLFFMLYWVLLALYVCANAYKSKLNGTMWGLLTLFTNLCGLIIYKIYKQSGKTCFKCNALQGKNNLYCTGCGAKIGDACEKCGGLLNIHDRFCKACGTKHKDNTDNTDNIDITNN